MSQFTVHWSPVAGAAEGLALFALWPSPVSDDVCFREAGFIDFGDGDEDWDNHADGLLTRLLESLSTYGAARLISQPVEMNRPWYRRAFAAPKTWDLRRQIALPIQWDELPDCLVHFGEAGVSLRTGNGHHIFWITLPHADAGMFPSMVGRVAALHPIVRTDLRWECLV